MAIETIRRTDTMGRKKSEGDLAPKGTMMRVSEAFAEKIKRASGERGLTATEFCDQFLTPCTDKAHREYIQAEAKRLAGGDK